MTSPEAASKADGKKLAEYHLALISKGVFFLPSKTGALSSAHSREDLDVLVEETENYVKHPEG
jgi:glutamate-1-semialdehyde aminotransferase